MRLFVSLALAFAICGSACAQEKPSSLNLTEKSHEHNPTHELSSEEKQNIDEAIKGFVSLLKEQKVRIQTNGLSDSDIREYRSILQQISPTEPFKTPKQIAKHNYFLANIEQIDLLQAELRKLTQTSTEAKSHDSMSHGTLRNVLGRENSDNFSCIGVAQQGGAVLCQTTPNAKVKVARSEKDFYFESADENGQIIIGFDRDETKNFVEVAGDRVNFDLKPRDYDTSRIDGLPPSQVSTFTDEQLKRIRSSSARKKVGFSSREKEMGFKDGFDLPIKAEFIKTTNFGAQRILNGEPKKPHYGVDLAAPVGTPIYAPADGIVSLADDDLYFEGAMVLLDHGQGLISMYLHTDEILVEPGQRVVQGQQIATVGSKGRSTGPHLCWRLKWRNRNLDPLLLTEWPKEG